MNLAVSLRAKRSNPFYKQVATQGRVAAVATIPRNDGDAI